MSPAAWAPSPGSLCMINLAPDGKRLTRARELWVPKTRVTWADPLRQRGWFGQALSVGPAGLGSAGGGMIFGLWA
jgi:hypothetical protein